MFWKAAKRERCESGDEHFGVREVSCGLGQLVSLGEVVAQLRVQRSTCLHRVAGQHATSPRQMFDLNVESYDLHRA
jgi:hypothetical protein